MVRIKEGGTQLFVPKESLGQVPPTAPVFFNPAASVNRDLSVAITEAAEGLSFCDALAGIGSRGVRMAKEVTRKIGVALVDINKESIRLGRRNAKLNGVASRCKFVTDEANSYLYSRYGKDEKFDFVDVDPFGTPVTYVQGALRATKDGGIASFTATDTAVLCGVRPEVAQRRYGGEPLNNHFHHETGVRLLLNSIRRSAASLDLGISPVAAHSTRHYIRVYVRVEVGASKADATSVDEGFVLWCRRCGHLSKEVVPRRSCEQCGARPKVAGPLWVGKLTEPGTVDGATAAAGRLGFSEAAKILAGLKLADGFPPWSFSIEGICSSLRIATVSDLRVAALLRREGFSCARQPFEKTGLKTDACYPDVLSAVREAGEAVRRVF